MQDDEILGKAYDSRLMRRLLVYLVPYWKAVSFAFVALFIGAVAALAQPYLMKVAIDRYVAPMQLLSRSLQSTCRPGPCS
jgi:ATP-binding cassette subfamily B multidrug efflux pump